MTTLKFHRQEPQKCLCGSNATITGSRTSWMVKCEAAYFCKRESGKKRTKLDAIRAWNTEIDAR